MPQIRLLSKIKILFKDHYEYDMKKYYFENNLQNIIFLEHQSDVSKCYGACNVLVFPSEKPHQARPVYEAGAANIPVIISDYPNTREFVNEENGYLFKPKDSKDLAEKIKLAYENKDNKDFLDKLKKNHENTIKLHNICDLKTEIKELLERFK